MYVMSTSVSRSSGIRPLLYIRCIGLPNHIYQVKPYMQPWLGYDLNINTKTDNTSITMIYYLFTKVGAYRQFWTTQGIPTFFLENFQIFHPALIFSPLTYSLLTKLFLLYLGLRHLYTLTIYISLFSISVRFICDFTPCTHVRILPLVTYRWELNNCINILYILHS